MKLQRMKNGGSAEGHAGMFWDGEKWVSSAGGATYSNGTFYANGGPVFPMGGAGPMFANGGSTASFYVDGNGRPQPFAMAPGTGQGMGYLQDLPTHMKMGGSASFYVDGNGRPSPFAMWPGSGKGSGYLEDLPETMKKGGHAKGKKMSPQQMQMMMQAMQGQGQPGGQQMMPPQPGMPQGAPAGQMMAPQGMIPQGQPMMPGMADGGIHIKPSNRGKFTAYKERTGKTTEEALHSKDPRVRKMANFARNAAKWHHEMGGAVTQGGNMVADNEMYAMGGQFHPLAKYMAIGGPGNGQQDTDLTTDPITGGAIQAQQAPAYNPANTSVVPQGAPPPGVNTGNNWATGMTPDQAQASIGPNRPSQQTPQQGQPGRGYNWAGFGLGLAGAALGVSSVLADRRDQENLRNKNFNDRSTVNQYAAMNQPGGMGDYDQYGAFRPNKNTPTRAGYFPAQQGPMGQFGGQFAMGGKYSAQGGMYHTGQELDLDDAEIARLQKLGYKFDML